jgi:uncharacterized membrane protein YfcA
MLVPMIPDIRFLLLGALLVMALVFAVTWVRLLRLGAGTGLGFQWPTPLETAIGFVTNFFDTLGIGSFAPTTAAWRWRRIVPDERIPATLNVGHTPPVIVQALIFLTIVTVEPLSLLTLIVAGVAGAWLGAGVVTHWPRRRIQLGMGLGLLGAGALMLLKNLDEMRGVPLFPGGDAVGLHGPVLAFAAAVMFVLGALVTLGIGMYAPCLILVSLLGMNPRAAFPIMMGACAFVMPVASIRFLRSGNLAQRPALGLALGGIPAVLVAALIVKSLPLTVIRWLVVVVVVYTAVTLLRSARET